MKTIAQLATVVSCLLTFVGCSSDKPLDVGDDQTGSSAQGLAAYEGAWDGYAEAYTFPSGSDRVRLTLDAEGHGTLELGDVPHFTCADTTLGCPPHEVPMPPDRYDYDSQEGFPYAVEASLNGARLQLEYWGTDPQKTWCEAQTAEKLDQQMAYTCAPLAHGVAGIVGACFVGENAEIPVDCGFIDTCWTACQCDVGGCTSRHDSALRLDGALEDDGDALVGTLMVGDSRITIRLTKP